MMNQIQLSKIIKKPYLLAFVILFIFAACKENPSTSYEGEALQIEEDAKNLSMVKSNADFPVFHQVFNHNTEPWATEANEGPTGWCGSIEHIDRRSNGSVSPSAGRGYATIMHGGCNEFWDGAIPGLTSGPASALKPDLISTKFPASGYVQQLDIYLDPAYNAGNEDTFTFLDVAEIDGEDVVFTFVNTVGNQVQELLEAEFVYFATFVLKEENEYLEVGDFQVDEAGWYTFRHVFGSDSDGNLQVDFELLQKGQLLYTESIEYSLLGVPTSSLNTEELGSAYLWFPTIADGLELPIDQHRLRPGK